MTTPARRRDAQLNREQILAAALRELTADPNATVDEIARAAGVTRRTVYGHFGSREGLLEAIVELAAADIARTAEAVDLAHGDPAVLLARFTHALWTLRARYVALTSIADRASTRGLLQQRNRGVREQVAALLERGQAEGRFAAGMPPLMLSRMLGSVMLGAIEAVADVAVEPDEVGDAVVAATLRLAGVPQSRIARVMKEAASSDR